MIAHARIKTSTGGHFRCDCSTGPPTTRRGSTTTTSCRWPGRSRCRNWPSRPVRPAARWPLATRQPRYTGVIGNRSAAGAPAGTAGFFGAMSLSRVRTASTASEFVRARCPSRGEIFGSTPRSRRLCNSCWVPSAAAENHLVGGEGLLCLTNPTPGAHSIDGVPSTGPRPHRHRSGQRMYGRTRLQRGDAAAEAGADHPHVIVRHMPYPPVRTSS